MGDNQVNIYASACTAYLLSATVSYLENMFGEDLDQAIVVSWESRDVSGMGMSAHGTVGQKHRARVLDALRSAALHFNTCCTTCRVCCLQYGAPRGRLGTCATKSKPLH